VARGLNSRENAARWPALRLPPPCRRPAPALLCACSQDHSGEGQSLTPPVLGPLRRGGVLRIRVRLRAHRRLQPLRRSAGARLAQQPVGVPAASGGAGSQWGCQQPGGCRQPGGAGAAPTASDSLDSLRQRPTASTAALLPLPPLRPLLHCFRCLSTGRSPTPHTDCLALTTAPLPSRSTAATAATACAACTALLPRPALRPSASNALRDSPPPFMVQRAHTPSTNSFDELLRLLAVRSSSSSCTTRTMTACCARCVGQWCSNGALCGAAVCSGALTLATHCTLTAAAFLRTRRRRCWRTWRGWAGR
jgi:hypothetical protein